MKQLPTCPCCKRAAEVFEYRIVRLRLSLAELPATILGICLVSTAGSLLQFSFAALLVVNLLAILPFCTRLLRRFVCERCQIDFFRSDDFLLKANKGHTDTPVSTANSSPPQKQ